MTASPVQNRSVPEVLVHTCDRLPTVEDDWVRRLWLKFTGGSEGAGNVLGEATFEQDYGRLKPALDGVGNQVVDFGIEPNLSRDPGDPQDGTLEGLIVRLTRRDPDGTLTPFWWGVIHGHTVTPDGDVNGRGQWTAVGLPSVLEQITINEGWIKPVTGFAPFTPGFLPPFNKITSGDRSEDFFAVNGKAVYVHDLSTLEDEGNKWTAEDILNLLLAGFSKPKLSPDNTLNGWEWVVDDPDGCLLYIPEEMDLNGMTLLEGVNAVINARRGLTWYYTVNGATVTIHVTSTIPDAIAIGDFSMPMSNLQVELDTTNDVWISNVAVDFDASQTCDILIVEGAQPWVGISAEYPGGLEKNWSSTKETAWDTNPGDAEVQAVWRSFRFKNSWPGTQKPDVSFTVGLGDTFTRSGIDDPAYGYKGLTGARTHAGGDAAPPSSILKTERQLPIGKGFENNRLDARQGPVLVFYDGSSYYAASSDGQDYHVEVNDGPPHVYITDESNGQENKDALSAEGSKFYVTIGIREATPLRVSWQRHPQEWPRRMPRVKMIKVPSAELWYMTQDCVTGVEDPDATFAGDTLAKSGSRVVIRDDTETLRAILALARAWYTVPSVRASWTDRGALAISDDYRPGSLLTTLIRGDTFTVNNVITRRRWTRVNRDGCDMWDTSYETTRMMPDLEGVL